MTRAPFKVYAIFFSFFLYRAYVLNQRILICDDLKYDI